MSEGKVQSEVALCNEADLRLVLIDVAQVGML